MNREIKFRAWGAKNPIESNIKEMDYSPLVCYDWKLNDVFDDRDLIFMQYTGLKDKNGKEIYEGDILKYKPYRNIGYKDEFEIDKVQWGETGDSDDWLHNKHYEWIVGYSTLADTADGSYKGFECEIIGNIYENPELLPVE